MKSFLMFVLGAAVGAFGGIVLAKKKLETEAYEYYDGEIEAYKQHVRNDILEADNLEQHDRVVSAKAINKFVYDNDLDFPQIDIEAARVKSDKYVDKKTVDDITKKHKYADAEYDEPVEDEIEEIEDGPVYEQGKIFEVTEEEADEYECEKEYECLFYSYRKGSSELIYGGHEFINITDVLEDYATVFIEGIHDVGDVVNIVNEELEQMYIITVIK